MCNSLDVINSLVSGCFSSLKMSHYACETSVAWGAYLTSQQVCFLLISQTLDRLWAPHHPILDKQMHDG